MHERRCEKSMIQGIIPVDQPLHYQAMCANHEEIMVFVSTEGVAAITWENVLWKRQFQYPEYITIKSIDEKKVCIHYDGPPAENADDMTLDLFSGKEIAG